MLEGRQRDRAAEESWGGRTQGKHCVSAWAALIPCPSLCSLHSSLPGKIGSREQLLRQNSSRTLTRQLSRTVLTSNNSRDQLKRAQSKDQLNRQQSKEYLSRQNSYDPLTKHQPKDQMTRQLSRDQMKTQLPKDELTKNTSQMKRQTSAKKISDGCRIHTEKPPIPVERERLQSRNKESQVSDRAADKIRNDGTSCQTLPSAARPPLSQGFSPDRRFNSSLSR